MKKKFENNLSFGQVNGFNVEKKEISFIFIGLITEELKEDASISMIVNLIKDEILIEEEALYTLKKILSLKMENKFKLNLNVK